MHPRTDGPAHRPAGIVSPLDHMHELAPGMAARYNGAALQRERILSRLSSGPATRAALERDCNAPSVTKRISELRRKGWRIEGEVIAETSPDGGVNLTTLYRLADGATAQSDLFEPA